MKDILKWLVTKLCLLIGISASAQSDYIATDSSLTTRIELISGTPSENSQFIRLRDIHGREAKYFPYQLTEYGFKNGTVYLSKRIPNSKENEQVFLRRLEQGKINLYKYRAKGIKTYFLERDSTYFVELKRGKNLTSELTAYTNDMNWNASQAKLVRYSAASLKKFVNLYNNDRNVRLPFPRFGVVLGFSIVKLKERPKESSLPSDVILLTQSSDLSFKPSTSLMFGIFTDLPISMSNFSLNVGLNFVKTEFADENRSGKFKAGKINLTSANIPFLLRYTLPGAKWRPFVNSGGVITHHAENKVSESEVEISNTMLGHSFGLGVEHFLGSRTINSFELRFNHLYGQEDSLRKSYLEFLTSISF